MPEVNEKPSPLSEKLREYENELRIKGLKDSTIRQQMYYLKEFCSYVDKPADLLERKDVVDYLVKARERLQESTYAILFVVVNSFLKFCKKDFELQAPKKPKKDRVFLSEEEAKKMIDSCSNNHERLVVKFLYTSGMRVSEACNARIEDMQPERGLIKIRQGKGGRTGGHCFQKAGLMNSGSQTTGMKALSLQRKTENHLLQLPFKGLLQRQPRTQA